MKQEFVYLHQSNKDCPALQHTHVLSVLQTAARFPGTTAAVVYVGISSTDDFLVSLPLNYTNNETVHIARTVLH